MRKNPHDRILKWEPNEQHLSTVPKSCPFLKDFYKNFFIYLSLQIYHYIIFCMFDKYFFKVNHIFLNFVVVCYINLIYNLIKSYHQERTP